MQSSERRFIQRDIPPNKVEKPKNASNDLYPNASVIPEALKRNLQTDQKVVKEFRGADAILRMFYFQLMKLAFEGHHQKDYVKIIRGILVGQDLFQKGQLGDRRMTDSQYRGTINQFLDLMSSQIVPNFEATAQNNPMIDDVLRKYFRKIVPITLYLNENHWELAKNVFAYLSEVFEVNFRVVGEFFRFDQSDFLVLVVRKDLIFATYAHDFRHISEVDQNSSSVLQLTDKNKSQTSNKPQSFHKIDYDIGNSITRKNQMEQLGKRINQKVNNSKSVREDDRNKLQFASPNRQGKRERDRSEDSVKSVNSVNSVNGVTGGNNSQNSLAYFPRMPRSNSLKNEEIINAYYSHENAVYLNHQTNDLYSNETAKFITPFPISSMMTTEPRSRTSRFQKPQQQLFSASSEYGFEKKPELNSSQNGCYSRSPVAYENERILNQTNSVTFRNSQGLTQIPSEARRGNQVQKEAVSESKRNEPMESVYKSREKQQRKQMLNSQKKGRQYRKEVNDGQKEAVKGSKFWNEMQNEGLYSSKGEKQRRNELLYESKGKGKEQRGQPNQFMSNSNRTDKVSMELMGKLMGRKQENRQYFRSQKDGNNDKREQLGESSSRNEKMLEVLIGQENKEWRELLRDRQAKKESPTQTMMHSRSNGQLQTRGGKEGRTLMLRDCSGKQKLMVVEERPLYDIPIKQSQRSQQITLSQRVGKQYYLPTEGSSKKTNLRHEIPIENINKASSPEFFLDSQGINQQQNVCEDNPITRLARSQNADSLFKKTSSKVIDIPLPNTPDQAPRTMQRNSMNQARNSSTVQISQKKNNLPRTQIAHSKLGRIEPTSRALYPPENEYISGSQSSSNHGTGKVLQVGQISNKSNRLAKVVRNAVESYGLSKSERQKENESMDLYGILPLETIDPVQMKGVRKEPRDSFVEDFAKDSFLDMIEEGVNTKILQISKQYREKKIRESRGIE